MPLAGNASRMMMSNEMATLSTIASELARGLLAILERIQRQEEECGQLRK